MSEIETGADVVLEPDKCRRKVQLTAKALTYKLEQLQKERKRNVNVIKSSIPAIKELTLKNENVSAVQSELEALGQTFKETVKLHDSVIPLLPIDEQIKQNEWFSSIYKYSDEFIKETNEWIHGIKKGHEDNQDQQLKTVECPSNDPKTQNRTQISMQNQDDINPSDSISNVGSKGSSQRSAATRRSTTSTTSSARIKAEADIAALLVRQNLMKEKHAIEEKEQTLRKQKEDFELRMEIAATMAKVKVLKGSSVHRVKSDVTHRSDVMNPYFDKGQQATQPLSADAN